MNYDTIDIRLGQFEMNFLKLPETRFMGVAVINFTS